MTRFSLLLILLLPSILHFTLLTEVHAAPHLTKEKPEPPSKVGKRIKERMKTGILTPMLANATTGTLNILFLRVDFPADTDSQTTGNGNWTDSAYACNAAGAPPVIANDMNCTNNPYDYWVNKAKDKFIAYFSETSDSALNLLIDISPSVYRLSNQMSSYGSESDAALTNLIYDSVQAADAEINFANYDAILIIHAGAGEETDVDWDSSSDIWSLYYSDSTAFATADGVDITEAIIMPQTDSQDGVFVDPFGVYAHEFGHWLGLPDLYVTSLMQTWDGIGKWGLMGDGIYNRGTDNIQGSSPSHPDAWCKTYLGWVTPQTISNDYGVTTLSAVETGPQIIKLQASTTNASQYFLLENRQLTGFDVGLPGSGMLVWLIDDEVINANIDLNTVNNDRLHPGVKLIEADGRDDLGTYGGDYGSPGDPFPGTSGNTSLTPNTEPASTPYTGNAWLCLKDIATSGSNINLTIGYAPTPPANVTAVQYSPTVLTWSANSESDFDHYNIYKNNIKLSDILTDTSYTDQFSIDGDNYNITAVDTSGNESAKSVTAYFDTMAPVNTTPPNFINNGASATSSNIVTLSISATDNGGVTGYYASENNIAPAADASDWIAVTSIKSYSAVVPFKLSSGYGTKTVYVWFKDGVGHLSANAQSSIVLSSTALSGSNKGGDDGGPCFIATAAYGSYEAPYVRILREFRDRYLLPNRVGSLFIKFYYTVSPPIADFIRKSDVLRGVVRVLLLPLIGFAAFMLKTSLVQKILFGLLFAIGLLLFRKIAAGLKPAATTT